MDWLNNPHPERNPLLWLSLAPYGCGFLLLLALAGAIGYLLGRR